MDYLKKAIWGEDPKEQHRRIKAILRRNGRSLEKSIREINALSKKTEGLIKKSYKKGDEKSVKIFAKELYGIKKQQTRLYNSLATLNSVSLQIEESFNMMKISQQMKSSGAIMHEVNMLVRLPELTSGMRDLERELMKSGIINEMVGDVIDAQGEDEEEEEEVEQEINKIVMQLTSDKLDKAGQVPSVSLPQQQQHEAEESVSEDDSTEDVLSEMRERLNALQS